MEISPFKRSTQAQLFSVTLNPQERELLRSAGYEEFSRAPSLVMKAAPDTEPASDAEHKHSSTRSYRRIKLEKELLCSINHKHLVPCLKLESLLEIIEGTQSQVRSNTLSTDPCAYLMPQALGDLSSHLHQAHSPVQVLGWLLNICSALEALEKSGLCAHRDIKPANILRYQEGLRLADLGTTLMRSPDGELLSPTTHSCGTPPYMAPELTSQADDCTAAADLYSLGIIAYELITGKDSVSPRCFTNWLERHGSPLLKEGDFPQPISPEHLQELNVLLMRLSAWDPGNRPQTYSEATREIQRCLARLKGYSRTNLILLILIGITLVISGMLVLL